MRIIALVKHYLRAVDECLVLFDRRFGRTDLVRARREGAIPPAGQLAVGVAYRMHGVGCAVEFSDHEVDFDFANQYEVGFDAWRLWRYAKQYPEQFGEYQELSSVESAIAECLVAKEIRRIVSEYPGESNAYMFQLSSAAPSS